MGLSPNVWEECKAKSFFFFSQFLLNLMSSKYTSQGYEEKANR